MDFVKVRGNWRNKDKRPRRFAGQCLRCEQINLQLASSVGVVSCWRTVKGRADCHNTLQLQTQSRGRIVDDKADTAIFQNGVIIDIQQR